MGYLRKTARFCALLALLAVVRTQAADPVLTIPFADSMVLQRHQPLPIWGKNKPGETVEVRLNGQTKSAKTGSDSLWRVILPAMPAGGPFDLTATSPSGKTTRKGVMIGEVWNCAGQSNMDTRLSHGEYPLLADSLKRANHPRMRFLTMRQPGQPIRWQTVTPKTAGGLSAAGYFFGRELLDHNDTVTIGLLVTAVGGTTVESWFDTTTAKQFPGVSASGSWKIWGAPVAGYAIRGTVWLQGENNTSSALYQMYGTRLKSMIEGWRKAWNQPEMPFIVGSLAGKGAWQTAANEKSNAATIRELQRRLCDTLPNTWFVPLIDLGDSSSWHYPQKSPAGRRLGLAARGAVLNENIVWQHPKPVRAYLTNQRIAVVFDNGGSPLKLDSADAPISFAVAGKDNVWSWASTSALKGDTVFLTTNIANPTQVRHAWGNRPRRNLRSQAGLPATSFQLALTAAPLPPLPTALQAAQPVQVLRVQNEYHILVPKDWRQVHLWNLAQGRRERTVAVERGLVRIPYSAWSTQVRLLEGPHQEFRRLEMQP